MQFSVMQTEVAQQTGLDITDTTNASNIQRWLNITQQDIVGRWPWEFLYSEEDVVTVPDYITGTVSVNSGGTTVTGNGTTFTSTMANGEYYIQFQGTLEWYSISAYSSATSITIANGYNGSSNLTNVTYIVRKFYYSLSSKADSIISVRNMNTPIMLYETDIFEMDELYPNTNSTGTTFMFMAYGYDPSGNIRISPYPSPSDQRNLRVRTVLRAVDMVNATDISVIPVKWHHVVCYGAEALGYAFLKNLQMAQKWTAEYEHKIEDMIKKSRISEENMPVLNSIDAGRRNTYLPFPTNYPRI